MWVFRRIAAILGQSMNRDAPRQELDDQVKTSVYTQYLSSKDHETINQLLRRGVVVTHQSSGEWPLLETEIHEPSLRDRQNVALDCSVCREQRFQSDYRSSPISADCTHEDMTCEVCTSLYLQYVITEGDYDWNEIQCPLCPARVPPKAVRRYLGPGMLAHFNAFFISQHIKDLPGFRWCEHGCRSGQVHLNGHDQPKMECVKCLRFSCFTHECVWDEGNEDGDHNEKTCPQIPKPDPDQNPEAATALTLKKITRNCPHCMVPIQKTEGCDEMYCTNCYERFLWSEAKWRKQ